MRRLTARILLLAGVIAPGVDGVLAQELENLEYPRFAEKLSPLPQEGVRQFGSAQQTSLESDLAKDGELHHKQLLIDKNPASIKSSLQLDHPSNIQTSKFGLSLLPKQLLKGGYRFASLSAEQIEVASIFGVTNNSDSDSMADYSSHPDFKDGLVRAVGEDSSLLAQHAESDQVIFDSTDQLLADGSALIDQSTLPNAIDLHGSRPKADPSVLPPAATTLSEPLAPLSAPPSLALPDKPSQVRIRELRPLTLEQVEQLVEVNSPSLKAAASQVDQAKSDLRSEIALWYPTVDLSANGLPQYFLQERYRNPDYLGTMSNPDFDPSDPASEEPSSIQEGNPVYTKRWSANFSATVQWNLIDPKRVPRISAARDAYEKAQDTYLITLRELRLQTAEKYFLLQNADEQVRIGQAAVRASQVSLQIARARFQAGVVNKLEVLEAETQLARDQRRLTTSLASQASARRSLAATLDLPQDVTPTAATPAQVTGLWLPSLQESIVAAYTFREELDQYILDISISNSNANVSLAAVQPIVSLVNRFSTNRNDGGSAYELNDVDMQDYNWSVDNALLLSASWRIFDGGASRAQYRKFKQQAEQNSFLFADERDKIRSEVEDSFYNLRSSAKNINTTSMEVLSSRESLRLARLRFEAGVTTQREVIDNQRDLTQAEVSYSQAITEYNQNLARLRRRTGLDQVQQCAALSLPAERPIQDDEDVPIVPIPERSACQASELPPGYIPPGV